MNPSGKRWTEEEIKKWANTSLTKKSGEYLVVQHYQDNLFHYFAQVGKFWAYKMNSVIMHTMEEQNG